MSARSPVGSRQIKTALGVDLFAKLGECQKGEKKIFIISWKTTSVIGKAVLDLWIDRKIQVLLKICIVVLIGVLF